MNYSQLLKYDNLFNIRDLGGMYTELPEKKPKKAK